MRPPGQKRIQDVEVILIEDDGRDVELLRAVLSVEYPANLTFVTTQDQFEQALKRQRPDIIVSDSNVIAFDGLSALKHALETYPDVPFVFCSGNDDPTKRLTALAQGATAWTSKNNSFCQLIQVLKQLCPTKR